MQSGRNVERVGRQIDLGVRSLEVQGRGDLLVEQSQRGLDDGGHAGGLLEVADIRLDGSDAAPGSVLTRSATGPPGDAKGARKGLDLQGVPEDGAGPVALDVGDALG